MSRVSRNHCAGFARAVLVGAVICTSLLAQSARKTVNGKVENTADHPLNGAIVYLQDARTMDVRSYITEADGVYRFGGISGDDDYKLWAELQGKKSETRIISSYDPKKSLLINLHIQIAQ
jgi:hypothetical protein